MTSGSSFCSRFFSIFSLAFIIPTSCERQGAKPAPEKVNLELPMSEAGLESAPGSGNTPPLSDSVESHSPVIVSPATLNRIFNEADEAFNAKQYVHAVAKIQEFLQKLGPNSQGAPYELLYFNLGLANLLGENYPEAEAAFKDYLKRYPKGEYASRSYLGIGRACMLQDEYEKKQEALEALKTAAEDPRFKEVANLWIRQLSQSLADP